MAFQWATFQHFTSTVGTGLNAEEQKFILFYSRNTLNKLKMIWDFGLIATIAGQILDNLQINYSVHHFVVSSFRNFFGGYVWVCELFRWTIFCFCFSCPGHQPVVSLHENYSHWRIKHHNWSRIRLMFCSKLVLFHTTVRGKRRNNIRELKTTAT